jgi:hypothetical protein
VFFSAKNQLSSNSNLQKLPQKRFPPQKQRKEEKTPEKKHPEN